MREICLQAACAFVSIPIGKGPIRVTAECTSYRDLALLLAFALL